MFYRFFFVTCKSLSMMKLLCNNKAKSGVLLDSSSFTSSCWSTKWTTPIKHLIQHMSLYIMWFLVKVTISNDLWFHFMPYLKSSLFNLIKWSLHFAFEISIPRCRRWGIFNVLYKFLMNLSIHVRCFLNLYKNFGWCTTFDQLITYRKVCLWMFHSSFCFLYF